MFGCACTSIVGAPDMPMPTDAVLTGIVASAVMKRLPACGPACWFWKVNARLYVRPTWFVVVRFAGQTCAALATTPGTRMPVSDQTKSYSSVHVSVTRVVGYAYCVSHASG